MALPYLDLLPASLQAGFETKVRAMGTRLRIRPEWIVLCMYRESGLKANAVNPQSKATGLIQFMPKTAIRLGTTVGALQQMNAVQQLPYVEQYLRDQIKSTGIHPTRLVDVYLLVFYPAAVGKPSSYVIARQGTTSYTQNSGISPYGDITVKDVERFINKIVPSTWASAAESPGLAAGGLLVGAGFAYVVYNQFFNRKQK